MTPIVTHVNNNNKAEEFRSIFINTLLTNISFENFLFKMCVSMRKMYY